MKKSFITRGQETDMQDDLSLDLSWIKPHFAQSGCYVY